MVEIAAIILSAGEGRRAGGPKAFLPIDGTCFLARIAGTLAAAGLEPVVAVVRAQDLDAARACAPSAVFAVNPRPERGMLSSVRTGIDATGARDGYCIIPVDHPLVQVETVRTLAAAFAAATTRWSGPFTEAAGIRSSSGCCGRVPAADSRAGSRRSSRAAARVIGVEVPDEGCTRTSTLWKTGCIVNAEFSGRCRRRSRQGRRPVWRP